MTGGSDADRTSRDRRRERIVAGILDEARRLVVERGVEALSLREVARRVDYSAAALYRYFPSREALVAALGMGAIEVLGRHVQGVSRDLPPAQRLIASCEAYVAFAEENPEQFALFERLHLPPSAWDHYVTVAYPLTVVVEAVADAMRAGVVAEADPAATAYGLWALAHGFASLRAGHLRDVEAPHAAMRRAAFEAHVRGLTNGAAR